MSKFLVKAYGAEMEFETREAAEVFFENNACAVDKVDGQYVREVEAA